jgi:hypothetical protein
LSVHLGSCFLLDGFIGLAAEARAISFQEDQQHDAGFLSIDGPGCEHATKIAQLKKGSQA